MAFDLGFVVLAAGKGTRLKSSRAKVLHHAGGLPLLAHVLRALRPFRAGVWAVVGYQADAVAGVAAAQGAETILQRPQLGTGHAVRTALKSLPRRVRRVVVLPGDAPLIETSSLRAMLRSHSRSRAAATVLTAEFDDPDGYGRIVRSPSGEIDAIVEQSALTREQQHLNEVNSSIYCFDRSVLGRFLARLGRENVHREYYLTDVIALARGAGRRVSPFLIPDPEEIVGANTRAELAWVDSVLRWRKIEKVMAGGVTLYRPDTHLIDPDVRVGADTEVEPGVVLEGATRVGRRCRIGAGCVLVNAVLGDGVTVRPYSLIFNSRVARGASVGPFAHLRDGAVIGPDARIGNFVEVKKTVVGRGAKAQHLTYLGDARIGRGTNVGAGTITCNYDGVNKNPTIVGSRTFIGSGAMLVAPVRVGNGAYIAAGSTITDDVPAHGLGIARGKQVNKPGWARTRRQKLAAAKARKEEPAVSVQAGALPDGKQKRKKARGRKAKGRQSS